MLKNEKYVLIFASNMRNIVLKINFCFFFFYKNQFFFSLKFLQLNDVDLYKFPI